VQLLGNMAVFKCHRNTPGNGFEKFHTQGIGGKFLRYR
jgi:hypothetical protein